MVQIVAGRINFGIRNVKTLACRPHSLNNTQTREPGTPKIMIIKRVNSDATTLPVNRQHEYRQSTPKPLIKHRPFQDATQSPSHRSSPDYHSRWQQHAPPCPLRARQPPRYRWRRVRTMGRWLLVWLWVRTLVKVEGKREREKRHTVVSLAIHRRTPTISRNILNHLLRNSSVPTNARRTAARSEEQHEWDHCCRKDDAAEEKGVCLNGEGFCWQCSKGGNERGWGGRGEEECNWMWGWRLR